MPATLLCVPILVLDEASARADMLAAKVAGADMIEFRIDALFTGSNGALGDLNRDEVAIIERLVESSPLPCIVTCRIAAEGGHYDADDMARIALYERLGVGLHPPAYLDLEHASYERSANLRQKIALCVDLPHRPRSVSTGLMLSMHDFAGRPHDLLRRIAAMQSAAPARVIKIVITARSIRDNLELFDILTENAAGRPTIALAMGPFGLMSRVLAGKFGALLTFAPLRRESSTAPGQTTLREMLDAYRFRSINALTRVYGVIGWPVAHSLSPLIHNAGFEAVEHDGVYLPLPVAAEASDPERSYLSLQATLDALIDHQRLHFSGASVTLPFKEHLVRWAELRRAEVTPLARTIGAANTLVRRPGGSILIDNTDAPAILDLLTSALGEIRGRRVGVVGAGGVARGAAAVLAGAGASVTIYNRTLDRAQRLADALGEHAETAGGRVDAARLDSLPGADADAFINCTSVGMTGGPHPDGLALPIPDMQRCTPGTLLLDTVYNPVHTPALLAAREHGWRTIDGVRMFVAQAARQFTHWTAQPAPTQLFDRVCREALHDV